MTGAKLAPVNSRLQESRARRRLVIVADNSLIAETIRIGFRMSGEFELVGYADGRRTAARTILDAQPEVILIDEMDQSLRSIELLRAIRTQDPNVAVLIFSIQLDAEWLERVFAAGATAVISKATRPAALATLVRGTLNGHIAHRPPAVAPPAEPIPVATAEDAQLTPRELEILQLVVFGSTNGDIARRLRVTERTVKFHLRNVYRKLDVTNRTQASHLARSTGLVRLSVAPERHLSVA